MVIEQEAIKSIFLISNHNVNGEVILIDTPLKFNYI